jgi:hypothetical protein
LLAHDALEQGAFLLELLKALRLIDPQAAVLLAPAIVGLVGNPELLGVLADRDSLRLKDFRLAEEMDDLLGSVSASGHVELLENSNTRDGSAFPGQVSSLVMVSVTHT